MYFSASAKKILKQVSLGLIQNVLSQKFYSSYALLQVNGLRLSLPKWQFGYVSGAKRSATEISACFATKLNSVSTAIDRPYKLRI